MYINNIDISTYNASVSEKLVQSSEILAQKEKLGLSFINISEEVGLKNLYIKILFEAANRDTAKNNISMFMANFTKDVDIKFKNLSNTFHSFLVNSNVENTDFDEWLYLILDIDCYEYGNEITTTMNRVNSKTINVAGNQVTPAIVEITPSIALVDLTLNGFDEDPIKIKNLTANKKIIINGEDGTVTVDGVNKYEDTEMWNFPSLRPGANTITVDKSSVDITIKYKPRYI